MRVRITPDPITDQTRDQRREALARDLLLKLVESHPHDQEYNVRAAVEYTDALLAKLEEPCDPTK